MIQNKKFLMDVEAKLHILIAKQIQMPKEIVTQEDLDKMDQLFD